MSIGTIVGHSYFGKGKVIETAEANITVDFNYPYGIKTVGVNDVAVIS